MQSTYADDVEAEYGDEYVWLVEFLRNGVSWPVPVMGKMHVLVIDSTAGRLESQLFVFSPEDEPGDDFEKMLTADMSTVTARMIYVQAEISLSVNRRCISRIAEKYKMDPSFLSSFLYTLHRTDSSNVNTPWRAPPFPLRSERSFLSTREDARHYMYAAVMPHQGYNLALILARAYPSSRGLEKAHDDIQAGKLPFGSRDAIGGSALDLLYPVFLKMVREWGLKYREFLHEQHSHWFDYNDHIDHVSDYRWQNLQFHQNNIERFASNLRRFLEEHVNEASLKWQLMLSDVESLANDVKEISRREEAKLQQSLVRKSIEEAQKGLTLSDSVRRFVKILEAQTRKLLLHISLTIVAFVFIPLNFASSIFGMNVSQLVKKDVSIGYFFLVASICSLLAILVASSLTPLHRFWTRERQKYFGGSDPGQDVRLPKWKIVLARLAKKSKLFKRLWDEVEDVDEQLMYERGENFYSGSSLRISFLLCRRALARGLTKLNFWSTKKLPETDADSTKEGDEEPA